jgi:hypothetical protein
MRRTKWYLGFLDFIGIGNFVGPDELDAQMGKGEVEDKLQEYSETDQSEKNWSEDFGTQESNPVSQAFSSSTSSTGIPKPTVGDLFGFFSFVLYGLLVTMHLVGSILALFHLKLIGSFSSRNCLEMQEVHFQLN